MKRTPPASVASDGSAGRIEPINHFADASKMIQFPRNWPVHRCPTPEEQARIRATFERRERLMQEIIA